MSFEGSPETATIATESKLQEADVSTLTGAEASAIANFPKGLKIKFLGVPEFGTTAYSWVETIGGTQYDGLNVNKGTTGHYIELSGKFNLPSLNNQKSWQ